MSTQAQDAPVPAGVPVTRIVVRALIDEARMAASDDPVFLQLHGPGGREFRLAPVHGRGFRRGADERYVLASPDDAGANVVHPELNDPTTPAIELASVTGVSIRKGLEPLPNVRGMAEMDDRLGLAEVEVLLSTADPSISLRFERQGPIWLGLVCGHTVGLARVPLVPGAS